MRHVFVINPQAGKGKAIRLIQDRIIDYGNNHGLEYEILISPTANESIERMTKIAEEGEPTRFYACGGDGTVYSVINAIYKYKNAEMAVIPLGSGNDFIRLFGTKDEFKNLDAQVNGTVIELDLIKCSTGDVAINQCSAGIDATINATTGKVKKIPLVGGEMAYMISSLLAFFGKMKNEFTIQIDEDPPFTVPVLFCLAANSRWYGGGFKGAPYALPDDGELDFIIVEKDRPRIKLLPLLDIYKKGKHLEEFLGFVTFKRGKKIRVQSNELTPLNIDGETRYANEVTFEVLEKAGRFVVPTTSTYIEDRKSGIISGDK